MVGSPRGTLAPSGVRARLSESGAKPRSLASVAARRTRPILYKGPMRWVFIACVGLSGCAILSPIPDMRTPSDRARELAPKCSGLPAGDGLLAPALVESVEPAYSYVSSGPVDRQARLRGARIHLRPTSGLSRESFQRTAECHEASVLLGRAGEMRDDPYVLPNAWLDISVDSEGDGFVASARTEGRDDANQVLERARRFAARGAQERLHAPAFAPRDSIAPQ
jgi:hypothetical protein